MSLDNFQLTPFLAGELYKDSLVDLDINQSKPQSVKSENLMYLGDNNRQILLIVDEENAVFLTDEDLNFLIGVLNACSLTVGDIALVNIWKNSSINFNRLQDNFKPAYTIAFGINLAALGFPLSFPDYQVQQYNQQLFLSAPALSILATDKKEKVQLWNCLKKMFSL